MPYSHYELIPIVLSEVKRIQPVSILDVGCGLGVYGFLCRIYLDLYDDEGFYLKLRKDGGRGWDITIDGIEGFQGYRDFIPEWVYDEVIIGDAIQVLSRKRDAEYDLVLALAILEHLDRKEGFRFLEEIRRVGRNAIVATPKEFKEQTVPDNPYETHRSLWGYTDFVRMGFNRFIPHWGEWIAIYDDKGVLGPAGPGYSLEEELRGIRDLMVEMREDLQRSLQQEALILDRLSLSNRLRGLLERLRGILKRG